MHHSYSSINYINFNQSGSCISMGSSQGFRIFNCEPFGKLYSENFGGYAIVEMLFSTSLLALVGIGDQPALSPRRLRMLNTKKHSIICEVTFPTAILNVKMNKRRLVVALKEQIYIYDINTMKLKHTIKISSNPSGIMAISSNSDRNLLVYPSPPKIANSTTKSNAKTNQSTMYKTGCEIENESDRNTLIQHRSEEYAHITNANTATACNDTVLEDAILDGPAVDSGDLVVFNLETYQTVMIIEAHKGPIAALTLSSDGKLLGTASTKGTIIRVFCTETGRKMNQFRRGTYPTKIYHMNFSNDNRFLVVTGATKTVHIFDLGVVNSFVDDLSDEEDTLSVTRPTTASNALRNELVQDDESGYSKPEYEPLSTNQDNVVGTNEYEVKRSNSEGNESDSSYKLIDKLNISSDKGVAPHVEASRKTVGRMIRYSSQKLSRKAAETLGQYLPIKLSSLIEPCRHFASIKLPIENINQVKMIASIGPSFEVDVAEFPELFESNDKSNTRLIPQNNDPKTRATRNDGTMKMVPVRVVSSEGHLYNYMLDPERGGDCILLSHYILLVE